MNDNKPTPRKRKKKINHSDNDELDETADHPVHEPYTLPKPYKE